MATATENRNEITRRHLLEEKKATFTSKAATLTLTLKPPRNRKNAEGDIIERIPGVAVSFEDHRASIEEDPYERVVINGQPITAEVDEPDGTTHPVTFEWIIDRLLGSEEKSIPPHWCLDRGVEHNAFYVDTPEIEPEPKLADQLAAITRAAVNRDVEAINEVLALERETHNREAVLLQGNAALEQIAEEE